MDTQPASEQNPENISPNQESDSLREQHLNLKLEVEQLYGKVSRLRGLLQTLVSGLILAIVIAIGVTGWFSYRLLVQEQIARRDAEKAASAEAEMLEKVEQLETQLQRLEAQLELQETQLQRQETRWQNIQQKLPDDVNLGNLIDTVQKNQRQLQRLSDRLPPVKVE